MGIKLKRKKKKTTTPQRVSAVLPLTSAKWLRKQPQINEALDKTIRHYKNCKLAKE